MIFSSLPVAHVKETSKFCCCYIASVTISSCLLASVEETLQVQHQTSFLYSQRVVSSGGTCC